MSSDFDTNGFMWSEAGARYRAFLCSQSASNPGYSRLMASLPSVSTGFEELVEFALLGKTPEEVLNFRPSPEHQERMRDLIAKEHAGTLTPTEQAVLDTAEQLEHLVVLMKMKAASRLG